MKDELKKEKIILEMLSDFYIFIMIILFPLMVDKTGFFHILEFKWYSYLIISSLYVALCVVIFFYFLIIKKINYFKNIKISIIQKLVLLFLLINIISCFFSPVFNVYNLFIGVGRGEGLIIITLYTLSYFFVSSFTIFKRKYFLYFSISSVLLNTIAILQYIGFNPFNMYQDGIGTHNVSFMTTIGNVDFISAMYCILLSVSFGSFVFLKDNIFFEKIIHLLSIFMGFFILGIIDVQSGKVAFLLTLLIVFPYVISNNKRLSNFIIIIATILLSYCFNIILNPEFHYDINRLDLYFQFNYIVFLFLIVCGSLIFLAFKVKKIKYDFSSNKKIIKKIYLILLFAVLTCIIAIYFINFRSGFLYEIHELLHGNFDDNFGTYRIFLWKRTIPLIGEYPIIGSGPDSFAIRFMAKYTSDIASIGPLTINDTAANVYLTMLINIGIVGLVNYLLFIYFQLKNVIKNVNNYSFILLISFICYLIQDFFNLSVVIVTPNFWILMALLYKSTEIKL